ncbi:protein Bch1p [Diutina catenulata]
MPPTTLASIPEAKEEYPGACLIERTSRMPGFVDLGPADLCNIQKVSAHSKSHKELGTFLYYTGIDTSNSASIAAHLQGVANLMTSKSQYWFEEKKTWKVPELTYCSYNAFSSVDMRVTVHIPGKFDAQVISQEGKLISDKLSPEEIDAMWQETFVSGMVRSVLDPDDEDVNKMRGLVEIRKMNPLNNGPSSTELVDQFFAGFEQLFWSGPKLGCGVDIPSATLINNYLVDGFLKVVALTQQYTRALAILERLQQHEPAVVTLVAKVLLMSDEEIRAVKVMAAGVENNPRDADLLLLQAEFCLEKRRLDLAQALARQAVKASPSDFKTWAVLVKVYTRLGDYENALLTLNSCPMNSHKERFTLRRVVPLRGGNDDLHLPSPTDVTLDEVSSLQSGQIQQEERGLDPQLLNLPAANLKSTFASAYDLLTEIVAKTGWETLLKYRAKVFVMEEEYRKDKNGHARSQSSVSQTDSADDAASTVAVKSPSRDEPTGAPAAVASQPAPTEQVDTEAEFRKKRLCERWLDNLFMLLYEDLRAYTMWQAESVHFRAKQMEYKKSTLEWEILGSIAYRLKHYKEGSVAFAAALQSRFSSKAQGELCKYYQMERAKMVQRNSGTGSAPQNYAKANTTLSEKILESVVKLLVWNHRWYSEFSPALTATLGDLIATEGLIKINSMVQALYSEVPVPHQDKGDHIPNRGITAMMDEVFEFYRRYKTAGADN